MENFGEYIKEQREKIGLSQRELARRIKVDNKTINNIEKNKTQKINYKIIIALANVFNINVLELTNKAGYATTEAIDRLLEEANTIDEMIKKTVEETTININTNEKKYDEYKYDEKYYDAIKILNAYKNGKLNEKETIMLIKICKPIDFNENKIFYPTKKGKIAIDINIKS